MERKQNKQIEHKEPPKEITDCLNGLNPYFATHTSAYTENCQRCVVAYEVRRRGYSALAKPYLENRKDLLPYMDRRYGWPAVFQKQIAADCSAWTAEEVLKNVERKMRLFGNHSRAIVKVNWLHRPKGHLFIAENIDDTIYFVDPQTGDGDVRRYFRGIDPGRAVLMRIDCVGLTELARQCCEQEKDNLRYRIRQTI